MDELEELLLDLKCTQEWIEGMAAQILNPPEMRRVLKGHAKNVARARHAMGDPTGLSARNPEKSETLTTDEK